nr:sigma factor-like helix-turn-helix DNA-binding protein [uncultured Caproiciproducens sp.]
MKPNSHEVHKQHAFDAFCKKVLKNEAYDCQTEAIYRRAHEVSLSELSQPEMDKLYVTDEYLSYYQTFNAFGYEFAVGDDHLAEALTSLPAPKRNIVLLAYYLDMTDKEIGGLLQLSRSTVQYHRASALSELKMLLALMEGNDDD